MNVAKLLLFSIIALCSFGIVAAQDGGGGGGGGAGGGGGGGIIIPPPGNPYPYPAVTCVLNVTGPHRVGDTVHANLTLINVGDSDMTALAGNELRWQGDAPPVLRFLRSDPGPERFIYSPNALEIGAYYSPPNSSSLSRYGTPGDRQVVNITFDANAFGIANINYTGYYVDPYGGNHVVFCKHSQLMRPVINLVIPGIQTWTMEDVPVWKGWNYLSGLHDPAQIVSGPSPKYMYMAIDNQWEMVYPTASPKVMGLSQSDIAQGAQMAYFDTDGTIWYDANRYVSMNDVYVGSGYYGVGWITPWLDTTDIPSALQNCNIRTSWVWDASVQDWLHVPAWKTDLAGEPSSKDNAPVVSLVYVDDPAGCYGTV
ncbi:hypothetical protein GF342_03235 [Candidatus Woesearchaeota archaeon]|nr:hypothetical protein [Candidatus Woesearchaeota archaeon]